MEGIWVNKNDDGIIQSHIDIYEENEKLYAKVVDVLPHAKVTHCPNCEGDKKGKPLEGMIIVRDLKYKSNNKYVDGYILDPVKGKEYKCQISLKNKKTLKLRGYVGKPLFGKSLYWYRPE